jgi:polysaccharide export outer membrane protein
LQKLPTQVVEDDGMLFVPYIGMFPVVGKTVREIEAAILKKLAGKANDAQILLQVKNRPSDQVTVLGDVNSSKNISLTPKGERILDAVSLASGVSNSLNKTMISMSRNGKTVDMPLESVIRNPEQNIYLNASDVIVAMYQPWSYTVMGATGKNQEINFEATGINLIEALARAGGISDSMADPRGVFVFRFEDQDTYKNLIEGITVTNKSGENVSSTDEKIKSQFKLADIQGKVPVIYEIDFEQPESFFRSQNFRIKNGDVIFVASASGYELSKFLRMLGLIVNPALSWGDSINRLVD